MENKTEGATFVHKNGQLVALVKRDEKSGKTITYFVREATAQEIAGLISPTE